MMSGPLTYDLVGQVGPRQAEQKDSSTEKYKPKAQSEWRAPPMPALLVVTPLPRPRVPEFNPVRHLFDLFGFLFLVHASSPSSCGIGVKQKLLTQTGFEKILPPQCLQHECDPLLQRHRSLCLGNLPRPLLALRVTLRLEGIAQPFRLQRLAQRIRQLNVAVT